MWPFRKKEIKRQKEDRSFVPIGSGGASYSGVFSPAMARCINLYCDLLTNCPLETNNENHPFYKLLTQRPCSFMSRANFLRLVVERYFIFNGFYALIESDKNGKITDLLPYIAPNSIQPYGNNFSKRSSSDAYGDVADPVQVKNQGWVLRDYKSRVFSPDELFIVRSAGFNTSTGLIEQEDMAQRVFHNTYEAASKLEACLNALCGRDLRPPLLLNNMPLDGNVTASSSEVDEAKQALKNFFDSPSNFQNVLCLPHQMSVEKLNLDNPSNVLLAVNEIVVSNICNLFNVPRSLVFSGATERDTKEARRIFIASGFKSFCTILTDEYNRLSDYKLELRYNLDQLRIQMADLREEAALAQLLDIYSKEELKKKIEQH